MVSIKRISVKNSLFVLTEVCSKRISTLQDVVEKLSERELNERIARIREKNKEREKRELVNEFLFTILVYLVAALSLLHCCLLQMIKEEIQAAKQKGGNAVVNIKSPIILDEEDDYGPTLYSDQINAEKRNPKITEWSDEVSVANFVAKHIQFRVH